MNKKFAIITSLSFLIALPALVSAQSLANNTAGATISIASPTNSVQPFTFQPSANVNILGNCTAQSYSVASYHNSAMKATGGEAYGLASDKSGTYVLDISASSATVTVGTTGNSADFASPWKAPTGSSGS